MGLFRNILDNWEEFRNNISFWKNDVQVPAPWEEARI